MQRLSKTISVLFLTMFISNIVTAQEHMIRGVIHTLDSIPLIGVEIKVKSTNQSVFTDSVGNFTLHCNSDDKLKIAAPGFYNQNVKITPNIKLVAVNLKPKNESNLKKYNIGYGEVSEKNRTSSVSGVNNEEMDFTRYSDVYDLIRSNFAGVQVRNGEINIRGSSSFNSSTAALIVLDGVIVESDILNSFNPIEIKSIDIIKDGSSAVYGARGANGVVLIETVKGNN